MSHNTGAEQKRIEDYCAGRTPEENAYSLCWTCNKRPPYIDRRWCSHCHEFWILQVQANLILDPKNPPNHQFVTDLNLCVSILWPHMKKAIPEVLLRRFPDYPIKRYGRGARNLRLDADKDGRWSLYVPVRTMEGATAFDPFHCPCPNQRHETAQEAILCKFIMICQEDA